MAYVLPPPPHDVENPLALKQWLYEVYKLRQTNDLEDLDDVTLTSIASGELLKWNGSIWINNTLAEAGISAVGHAHATSDITSGTFADARIAESNVTQHEAAIDHDALTNFTSTEHYAQSAISIPLSQGSDVTITAIASGELLKWSGSAWINNTIAEAGLATAAQGALADSALQDITSEALSTLGDVTITSIATNELLQWDGAAWINQTFAEMGVALDGGAHHDGFSDFVADEHIDWKSTSENFNTSGTLTTTGAFTSLGIDDNATAEMMELTNGQMKLGIAGANFGVINKVDDQFMSFGGGSSESSGANTLMYGGTHANTGDMVFRNDANQWMRWDESAGELEISTGIGAKTTALTISPALKATFAGAVTVAGTFNSLGIDDNATGERLQLADSSIQFGDGSAGESFLISLRSTTSGQLNLSGSTGSTTGAATLMYGSTHASRASDMRFRADNNTWMEWDESVGDLEISTGAAGAKTTALTIDSAQKATFAGAVTVQGAFTSLGIDDNATTEVMQLSGGAVSWGDASSGETYNQSIRTVTDGSLTIAGGNSNTDGGAISYYGSTHATLPGDIIIRSSNNTLLQWDESAGDLEIKTGVGAKTTALTIDASQNAAYAAALTAVGGVDKLTSATTVVDVAAATAPVSGQVLTATGDSAATWQTAAGGGAVGDAFLLMGG